MAGFFCSIAAFICMVGSWLDYGKVDWDMVKWAWSPVKKTNEAIKDIWR